MTTGALVAPGASVSGASVHNRPHPTVGALLAQGAILVGAANHTMPGGAILHDTAGAIIGQGAAIAGGAYFASQYRTLAIGAEDRVYLIRAENRVFRP